MTYARLYTARIDCLKMFADDQPPKFQQFHGKGSPKKDVAHFIEACKMLEDMTITLSKNLSIFLRSVLLIGR